MPYRVTFLLEKYTIPKRKKKKVLALNASTGKAFACLRACVCGGRSQAARGAGGVAGPDAVSTQDLTEPMQNFVLFVRVWVVLSAIRMIVNK